MKFPFRFDFAQYYKVPGYKDIFTEKEAEIVMEELEEAIPGVKRIPKILTFIRKK